MLCFFFASWLLRGDPPEQAGGLALTLACIGAALAVLAGWFGGELVNRLGVGVYDDVGLNATRSFPRDGGD